MVSELVNVSMGMRANGSCRLINTFSMSFITVRSCIPENVATRGREDSDASGEQNTHPALPFEIQETLNIEEKKGNA